MVILYQTFQINSISFLIPVLIISLKINENVCVTCAMDAYNKTVVISTSICL